MISIRDWLMLGLAANFQHCLNLVAGVGEKRQKDEAMKWERLGNERWREEK